MKSRAQSFQTILAASSGGFVVVTTVAAVLFRAPGAEAWGPLLWSLGGGALFAVAAFFLIRPLEASFLYNFAACVDAEDADVPGGYRASLQAIGGAPLLALIRMFGLVALFAAVVGTLGLGMGLTGPALAEFGVLVFSFGMLASSFVYVILDRLALRTLLEASLTCYPASLRENRQQRKIFIIPVFMSLMSLLFAFSTALLLTGRGDTGLGIVGSAAVLSAFYLTVVTVLVGSWNSNTALLYRSVLVQLDQLTQAEKDLSSRISIGSVDEIGSISGRVNAFCEGLSDGLKEVAATHGELAAVQQRLFGGIDTATTAAQEIGNRIDAALAAIERADQALADSLANARELARHTRDASGKIGDQSARVAASTEGVQSVMETVGRLSKDVAGARQQTEDLTRVVQQGEEGLKSLVDTVNAVANRSADLEKVNKLIATVAARTNLLAMNAAIEAAHAGDSGRGFSVVAEEIRTLAESTADHTRRSRQSLSAILTLVQDALNAARAAGDSFAHIRRAADSVSQVTAGVSTAMDQEGRRGAQILSLLAETEALGKSVAEATKALDALAETTAVRLSAAADDQSKARSEAKQMTDRNRDLAGAMDEVNTFSDKTEEINTRLATFLKSFKT